MGVSVNPLQGRDLEDTGVPIMFQKLLDKYDLQLPRYTSYPTTPHFSKAVEGKTYATWLSTLPKEVSLSLYVHIPYCTEMCWFCGCHTSITKKYKPVSDYLDALLTEINLAVSHLSEGQIVQHVHFGGGSPTILSPEDFLRTMAHLRSSFPIASDAEIAVEVDPRTANETHVAAMAAAGVNRVSIGVQDFNKKVQKSINRINSYNLIQYLVYLLRSYAISAVNMDLIYGLPYQTAASMVETIDAAVTLAPQRLSLFGYAHVPWMKKHQLFIDSTLLPSTAERWQQYETAHARLQSHGYIAVGLDHYAAPSDELVYALREKRLKRNFQGYTSDRATVLVGFGASAIGSMPQGYVINESAVPAYKRLIRAGMFATCRGIILSQCDFLRRAIIERLMCDMAVDLDVIAARFGLDSNSTMFIHELNALAELEADGIIVRDGQTISVTPVGRPLVRVVCAVFDRYLQIGTHKHSRAV